MTQRSRAALKAFFQTGLKPTQSNFGDLIESVPNFGDLDPSGWLKLNIKYSDISAAGTSFTLTVNASVPAKCIFLFPSFNCKTYFSGGTISQLTIIPYTNSSQSCSSISLMTGINRNCITFFNPYTIGYTQADFTNPWAFKLVFTSTGGNLNTLSAGELDFYYLLQQLT